jgi:hypothetical protein
VVGEVQRVNPATETPSEACETWKKPEQAVSALGNYLLLSLHNQELCSGTQLSIPGGEFDPRKRSEF